MKHRGNEESTRLRSTKSRYVVTSLLVCLFIRILAFSLFNVIQGSNYKYINMLINIENMQNEEMKQKDNYIRKGHYTPLEEKSNELEKYFEKNKRNNELRQFIFKNDSMHYSFNSDVYNFKYIYDSYILSKIYKDIYSSLTVRINPLFLYILHILIFKKIAVKNNKLIENIMNNYEFRYYIIICIVDLLIGFFLFIIIEKLKKWRKYFNYVNTCKRDKWRLINSILLMNIYLNNPFTILANVFLSLDNFKLLLITTSFYLTLLRISNFSNKLWSVLNHFMIMFCNSILLYISSFHFILSIIGINNLIICIDQGVTKYDIKENIKFFKLFLIILKNVLLLLITFTMYTLLIVTSYYLNSSSLSFLDNTLINEYKVLFLQPNLGNFWYIFSTMFKDYYYSFLFLFHFHIFLYPLPLFFRLMKTPLIYLKIMIAIALMYHPNITINDIVYSLLLLAIDYEKTLYTIPFAKLLIILLGNLNLFFVTMNLWLRKNTGNANYVFFNQLVVFNITTFIITSSIKFYIRVQTPIPQLDEGKCIIVSQKQEKKCSILNTLKETFL
ncbi:GPI transamidase subunit PIG-U, putative [Plasmodium malariae]|uniref:GPI transamidase subunit PIG-U, putative n=1 Tax=Plasmodium malariae TaxID=5858 RepID=A0A1D3SPA6_PLAMA|nr:GPI transamidase subunit PIG-U, putative [Plasmodium malariae]SCO93742.1 GPI transamidase subunit PIG-U, putative [Plasmodium malariae]